MTQAEEFDSVAVHSRDTEIFTDNHLDGGIHKNVVMVDTISATYGLAKLRTHKKLHE